MIIIIIDFSQIVHSNVHQNFDLIVDDGVYSEGMLRSLILNSVRGYKRKFGSKYGQIIIAVDSRTYWRRQIFPHYKANRKAARASNNTIDWTIVFDAMNDVKSALKEHFKYKVIEVDGAEADDIIGVLTRYKHTEESIMIISSDHDFKQLQQYNNVKQWSPMHNILVKCDSPKAYLSEHIIRGDKGDGIPNYLSRSNFFVDKGDKERQKNITKKKVADAQRYSAEKFCENTDELARYKENEMLIDLSKIPEDIRNTILREYEVVPTGSRNAMMSYMMKWRMRQQLSMLDEF